jgi:hypothetical protein
MSSVARADVVPSAPSPTPEPVALKNPNVALGLSLGTTVAGVAVTVLAASGPGDPSRGLTELGIGMMVLGPTTGHVYAGSPLNTGLAVRASGVAAGAIGFGMVAPCLFGTCQTARTDIGVLVLGAGAITYAIGTIYEIGDAHGAARRHNERVSANLVIAPLATPSGTAPGVGLAGHF